VVKQVRLALHHAHHVVQGNTVLAYKVYIQVVQVLQYEVLQVESYVPQDVLAQMQQHRATLTALLEHLVPKVQQLVLHVLVLASIALKLPHLALYALKEDIALHLQAFKYVL
jgi:hypothetical protein